MFLIIRTHQKALFLILNDFTNSSCSWLEIRQWCTSIKLRKVVWLTLLQNLSLWNLAEVSRIGRLYFYTFILQKMNGNNTCRFSTIPLAGIWNLVGLVKLWIWNGIYIMRNARNVLFEQVVEIDRKSQNLVGSTSYLMTLFFLFCSFQ